MDWFHTEDVLFRINWYVAEVLNYIFKEFLTHTQNIYPSIYTRCFSRKFFDYSYIFFAENLLKINNYKTRVARFLIFLEMCVISLNSMCMLNDECHINNLHNIYFQQKWILDSKKSTSWFIMQNRKYAELKINFKFKTRPKIGLVF